MFLKSSFCVLLYIFNHLCCCCSTRVLLSVLHVNLKDLAQNCSKIFDAGLWGLICVPFFMSAGLKEGERGIIFDGETHDDRLDHEHHQQQHHQDHQQHHDNHADHIKLVQVMLAILGLCLGCKLLPLLLFLHGDPPSY